MNVREELTKLIKQLNIDSRTPLLGKVIVVVVAILVFVFFFQGKLLRFVVVCQLTYNGKKRYLNHVKKRMF